VDPKPGQHPEKLVSPEMLKTKSQGKGVLPGDFLHIPEKIRRGDFPEPVNVIGLCP
jgi:hypothetical protein